METEFQELAGYSVRELITGTSTAHKWSVALLKIGTSPKHYHRIEQEVFVVLEGILKITVNGFTKTLLPGQSIEILPNEHHQLISGSEEPVCVVCVNIPAFDPEDMYIV